MSVDVLWYTEYTDGEMNLIRLYLSSFTTGWLFLFAACRLHDATLFINLLATLASQFQDKHSDTEHILV